jgi:hypothetical protein
MGGENGMQPAVRNAWRAFNQPFEGLTSWMYLDIRGLVTTGMGNLIDPLPAALELTWRHEDDTAAAQADVIAEWNRIKENIALAHQGALAARAIASLHLADSDINALILRRLASDEAIVKAYPAFAGLEEWPADAQLGLMSMAWAMGAGFGPHFPNFSHACAARDFATAATDCEMDASANPALARRNAADRQAFLLAANATDPAVLHSHIPPF